MKFSLIKLILSLYIALVSQGVFAQTNYSKCFDAFYIKYQKQVDILLAKDVETQALLWKVRSSGDKNLSMILEKSIMRKLIKGDVISDVPVNSGITGARFVQVDKKLNGIFKGVNVPDPKSADALSVGSEIAAYKLDKLFGFDLVPVTVARKIRGEIGSIQLFYKDARLARDVSDSFVSTVERERLDLFDYLVENRDRGSENFLISPEGKVIAIDHGLAFRDYITEGVLKDARNFLMTEKGQQVLMKLRSTPDDEIKKLLERFIIPVRIEEVLERRRDILREFGNIK